MAPDVTLTIDGTTVVVPAGTLLVEAAKLLDVEIPVYCYHEKLGPAGLCRVCLVEVEGMPKLQIGCNTPATQGMVVNTMNPRVGDGRRAILEFLLLNHPLDCPICDKGGECDLQDYVMAYGQDASRLADPKESKPKAVDLGPTIVLDEERCIVCQRCVRFDDIITRERSLVVVDRGVHDIIATATGHEYRSDFSGNVTELCPVGALTSKTYRFRSRKWDNARVASSCTQCQVGCAIQVDTREHAVTRTMSVPSDVVSDGWLCDRGRYNIGFINDERRLRSPLYRDGGRFIQIGWDDAIALWAKALRSAKTPRRVAALGGARLLNEEAYLLAALMRAYGTPNLDWRTGRQLQTLPGNGAGNLDELEHAEAIIVVGRPPAQSAPIFDLRLRKAVSRNGAQLIVVGAEGSGSHVAEQRVDELAAVRRLLPVGVARVALIWDGAEVERGRELWDLGVALVAGGATVRTYIAASAPNARGAEAMGMHPRFAAHYELAPVEGLNAAAIIAAGVNGELDVLSLHGANPVLQMEGEIEAALARIPFVVATELFETETTRLATLVLPVASAFEREGHMTNLLGERRVVGAALEPPQSVLTDGEIIVALADALELELPSPEATLAAALAANTREAAFTLGDERLCGPRERRSEERATRADDLRLRLVIRESIFAGGGTVAHDEAIATLRTPTSISIAPQTAQHHGVVEGEYVHLRSEQRRLAEGVVAFDPRLAEGCVALVNGLSATPLGGVADGTMIRLESARALAGARS